MKFNFNILISSVLVVIACITLYVYPISFDCLCPIHWISYFKQKQPLLSFIDERDVKVYADISDFTCSKPETPCYLAVLGRVYDVTTGEKHYGPTGGYHFFTGRDATQAFVTGNFTEEGLVSDVKALTVTQMHEVLKWLQFYEDRYIHIGKLSGPYYDARGVATPDLHNAEAKLKQALLQQAEAYLQNLITPPCDSNWNKESGNVYSCSKNSGGFEREWEGMPRRYFYESQEKEVLDARVDRWRCICIQVVADGDKANVRTFMGCPDNNNICIDIDTANTT